MIICLGPICIPVWGLIPFLGALLLQLKAWFARAFGGAGADADAGSESAAGTAFAAKHGSGASASASSNSSASASASATTKPKSDANAEVIAIASGDHLISIIESHRVVVIDFTAAWCQPCKRIAPVFSRLCAQCGSDDVAFVKVDVDLLQSVAEEFGVMAMPTFVVMRRGAEVRRLSSSDESKLVQLVVDVAVRREAESEPAPTEPSADADLPRAASTGSVTADGFVKVESPE